MDQALASYLTFYGITVSIIRPGIVAALLVGLWWALRRTDLSPQERTVTWLAVSLPLVTWFVVIWNVAAAGLLETRADALPLLPLAIFLPVLIGVPLMTRSRRIGAVLDHSPAAFLIGLQVYRALGANFLVLWSYGSVPGEFALPAGLGDVAVGLLALPAAFYVASGVRGARGVGIAWNLLGIADLITAVTLGMLTSPGPLHRLALDHPNLLTSVYPTVLTPAFAVPLSLTLHATSLRQLLRLGKRMQRSEAGGKGLLSVA